ncbi:hypothetical protein [Ensifer sesbaniae]|uniref:hypothetical protein n=1 Tax=Ensifer sesbaniae TaxID=1214071 RepID=UPI001568CB03|nr:hypothetical protein [Ensifer sesbaniae]NRQ15139.1 hypothetical protein [Ensifer sesbaniae]
MSKPHPKSRDLSQTPEDGPGPAGPGSAPLGKIPPVPADQLPEGDDLPPVDQGRVPPVPSRDEANVKPDDALPADSEEKIIDDDPARDKTRFDEELPKSSR